MAGTVNLDKWGGAWYTWGIKRASHMRKGLSLYIHIPFCASKCNYCSFSSFVSDDDVKLRYIEALKKEIGLRGKELSGSYEISTVYIGGGTPSSLPLGCIKAIMAAVYKNFVVRNNAEITIEINPNSIDKDKIKEYQFAGVNRFSVGLQCVSKAVLKEMGRTHTVEDFTRAVTMLKRAGVGNISADIILGYPKETQDDVARSVDLVTKLGVNHVSTYMLSVEEGTPLFKAVNSKLTALPDEDEVIRQYNLCAKKLAAAGFERYEVSNFAKPSFKSRHNQVYWKRQNYLGLGLAAHSFLQGQRWNNTDNLPFYISCLESKGLYPIEKSHTLSPQEAKEEWVMLSLRRTEGLDTEAFKTEFGENFLATRKEPLARLIRGGFITLDTKTNHVRATDKGFLVLNKIIEELA